MVYILIGLAVVLYLGIKVSLILVGVAIALYVLALVVGVPLVADIEHHVWLGTTYGWDHAIDQFKKRFDKKNVEQPVAPTTHMVVRKQSGKFGGMLPGESYTDLALRMSDYDLIEEDKRV